MPRAAAKTTIAATLALAALAGSSAAHEGDIVVYRNSAGQLFMNYPWSTPTFLDEVLEGYRGDAFRLNINRLIIPNVSLDQYPPYQGSQIYIEVTFTSPHVFMRDGINPATVYFGPDNRFFAGEGGTAWTRTVWLHADQFHPEWNWGASGWGLTIKAIDLAGMHTSESPEYSFGLGLEHFCPADLTETAIPGSPGYLEPNNIVDNEDFFAFLTLFAEGHWRADGTTGAVPGQPGYGDPNGLITNDDFFYYLSRFVEGCHF